VLLRPPEVPAQLARRVRATPAPRGACGGGRGGSPRFAGAVLPIVIPLLSPMA
jgi:hypothetical protein